MTGLAIVIPVEIICVACSPPLFCKAEVLRMEGGTCEVRLLQPEGRLEVGHRLILDCWGNDRLRILGQVRAIDAERVEIDIRNSLPPDKRAYPRLFGGIEVRYKAVPRETWSEVSSAWLAGEAPAPDATWQTPDPFMDFSVSGLKFEGPAPFVGGDFLLVELKVPLEDQAHRTTARVVRVDPLPTESESDSVSHMQVAIHFLDLTRPTAEALVRFTLHLQEALL
jgi:hypothetical protein